MTGAVFNKKPPAEAKVIAKAAPTLMKKIQLAFGGLIAKVFSRKTPPVGQSAATAKTNPQPQLPVDSPAPVPEGASGENSKREDAAAAGSPGATEAPAPPEQYCLQLGAFTNLKLAQQLQATLKDKGYTAIIFEGVDVGYKRWHAVRISKYPDMDSATKAAADFTAKEKLQAIVRPSGQL